MTITNNQKENLPGFNPNIKRSFNPLLINQRRLGVPIKRAFADLLSRNEPTEASLQAFLNYQDDFGIVTCALASRGKLR